MDSNMPHIQSITFHEGGVEIVYAEASDIANLSETGILRTRVVMCPAQHVEPELAELMEDASELLDKILIAERNPAQSFRR